MKISIAMTTCNGSKFIIEQLDSIRRQSRKPDEVIICDDVSSDNTVELVKEYIYEYNLYNWRLFTNEKRLGWKLNFRRAIEKTEGDIVFFSDQDDIWMDNKIEKMSSLMTNFKMGCLYGKSLKIDERGRGIKNRNEQKKYSGRVRRISFKPSFYTVGGLGCCMCVSRSVIHKYLELNCKFDDHDSQCPRIAVLYDSLWVLDEPVIRYRIHPGNTSEISDQFSYGSSSLRKRIENIRIINRWLMVVMKDREISGNPVKMEYVLKSLKMGLRRVKYLTSDEISIISILKYWKYYSGVTMLVGDMAYKFGMNKILGKVRWKLGKFF